MQPGDIVIAKITSIVGYGAFVSVGEYLGLVHISEFSDNYVKSIKEFVSVGQEIRLRVLEIDEENKKVKLSYKQLHKTRGIKCRVPEYNIGFKSLGDKLEGWVEKFKLED
ncbi:MAG: S1 RNA-binding domain-containing protein [Erysipelotrichaceae bacterium]|nr:S1 RNA-binding domain-containing protein [Erysipelotrichaceae bacterium]